MQFSHASVEYWFGLGVKKTVIHRRIPVRPKEAQTEAEPSVVEAHAAELEAAEQRASSEQTLRQAAEQTAAAMTTAWMDAERAHTAAETARAAAEGALADALAAHGDTGRVEMVAASTNTKYLVDGVGLASTGSQTTMHVLSPHRHFPTAPPLHKPRSSTVLLLHHHTICHLALRRR